MQKYFLIFIYFIDCNLCVEEICVIYVNECKISKITELKNIIKNTNQFENNNEFKIDSK